MVFDMFIIFQNPYRHVEAGRYYGYVNKNDVIIKENYGPKMCIGEKKWEDAWQFGC